jgi:diacylglycerol kinase
MKHKREIGIIKDLAAAASAIVSVWVLAIWIVFMFA